VVSGTTYEALWAGKSPPDSVPPQRGRTQRHHATLPCPRLCPAGTVLTRIAPHGGRHLCVVGARGGAALGLDVVVQARCHERGVGARGGGVAVVVAVLLLVLVVVAAAAATAAALLLAAVARVCQQRRNVVVVLRREVGRPAVLVVVAVVIVVVRAVFVVVGAAGATTAATAAGVKILVVGVALILVSGGGGGSGGRRGRRCSGGSCSCCVGCVCGRHLLCAPLHRLHKRGAPAAAPAQVQRLACRQPRGSRLQLGVVLVVIVVAARPLLLVTIAVVVALALRLVTLGALVATGADAVDALPRRQLRRKRGLLRARRGEVCAWWA
jgi:hypothetical protein